MARARGEKRYINLLRGLNTEESPLDFPIDASVDELNMTVDATGRMRRRRLGLRQEGTTVLGTGDSGAIPNKAITTYEWLNVAEDSTKSFLVTQVGGWLNFMDITLPDPTARPKNFSIDLTIHRATVTSIPEVRTNQVQMDSIKGQLIVVGEHIKPFRLIYDPDTDTLAYSPIALKTRDLEGIEDSLDVDERPAAPLSEEHEYNLYNQGWYENKRKHGGGGTYTDPIVDFFSDLAVYPSNSDIVYLGSKVDASDDQLFDPKTLKDISLGNSTAPRGHYVLFEFQKLRETHRLDKTNSGADSGIGSENAASTIRPVV